MIYDRWMEYISDDAPINKIAIPGAHNSGSYGMPAVSCCQDGDIYEQYMHGARHFCLRLDTRANGKICLSHGLTKGDDFEKALGQLSRILRHNSSEFLILDIREYYPQKIGPITLRYHADEEQVNRLLEEYIKPSEYALTDFDDISKVTMGDIRRSGKRFILLCHTLGGDAVEGDSVSYKYSADCECILPWEKNVFGSSPEEFAKGTIQIFDENSTDGFYWFQTQRTPNIGTEVGLTTPRKLNKSQNFLFSHIIDELAAKPERLEKVNIVGTDFITENYAKPYHILMLNEKKGYVTDTAAFEEGLKF